MRILHLSWFAKFIPFKNSTALRIPKLQSVAIRTLRNTASCFPQIVGHSKFELKKDMNGLGGQLTNVRSKTS